MTTQDSSSINPSGETSLSLIYRATNLDSRAWERMSRLYCPLVLEWVIRSKVPRSDASDVVQDVFLAVAKNLAMFKSSIGVEKEKRSFRGWLWGITRHKILDYFRNRNAGPVAVGGSAAHMFMQEITCPDDLEDSQVLSLSSKSQFLLRALEIIKTDFEETTWRAFWMITIDGYAAKDVAKQLGLSIGAVYTAKSRVLSLLRREFDGLETFL